MDIKTLLAELKRLVIDLAEDLLQRSVAVAEVDSRLRELTDKLAQRREHLLHRGRVTTTNHTNDTNKAMK